MTPVTATKKRTSPARARPDSEVISKARLADEIRQVIGEKGLSQTAAAAVAREAQSQMSLVMSGHLQGFSANRLIRMLLRLGRDVEIIIRRPTRTPRGGRVKITVPKPEGRAGTRGR
ncbi:MAG: XRE family transcriptional regulator [Gemmatimonadaceae bacterium]